MGEDFPSDHRDDADDKRDEGKEVSGGDEEGFDEGEAGLGEACDGIDRGDVGRVEVELEEEVELVGVFDVDEVELSAGDVLRVRGEAQTGALHCVSKDMWQRQWRELLPAESVRV